MATSGSMSINLGLGNDYEFRWERTSTSPAEQYSVVKWEVVYLGTSSTYLQNLIVTVDGTQYLRSASAASSFDVKPNEVILTNTQTLYHQTGQTRTFSYEVKIHKNQYSMTTRSSSGTLDAIPMPATITAAPNFNDEENPTITYNCITPNLIDDLEACIEWAGGMQTIKYRDISKTGTSYTFNLTDAERTTLRQGITSGGSRSIRFTVRTQIGGKLYTRELTRTCSLVNHEPTLSPGIYDANSATTALTGNSNTIVRYASNVYYDAGASAHKEATLTSTSVINGELTLSSGTGYIEGPASEKFSFEATDSRGFTVKQDLTAAQWVPYVRFTTSLRVVSYTLDGNCTFGLSGNYYNGSFGAEDNRIYINMALFKNGQYYEEFKLDPFVQGTFTPNDTNTAYDYQYTITGLTATEADGSYNTYTIQAEVRDKLSNYILTDEVVASAVPVFDWSKNDFNFNVPVHFGRGFTSDVGLKTATNEPRVINIAAAGAHEIGTLSEMGIDYYDQRVYSITGTLYAESSGRTYPLPIPTLTLGVITTPAYSLAEAARLWIEDDTIYLTTGAAWGNVRVYLVLQYF